MRRPSVVSTARSRRLLASKYFHELCHWSKFVVLSVEVVKKNLSLATPLALGLGMTRLLSRWQSPTCMSGTWEYCESLDESYWLGTVSVPVAADALGMPIAAANTWSPKATPK